MEGRGYERKVENDTAPDELEHQLGGTLEDDASTGYHTSDSDAPLLTDRFIDDGTCLGKVVNRGDVDEKQLYSNTSRNFPENATDCMKEALDGESK